MFVHEKLERQGFPPATISTMVVRGAQPSVYGRELNKKHILYCNVQVGLFAPKTPNADTSQNHLYSDRLRIALLSPDTDCARPIQENGNSGSCRSPCFCNNNAQPQKGEGDRCVSSASKPPF